MKTADTDLIDVLVILLLSVIVACGMLIAYAIVLRRVGRRMIVYACLGDGCNKRIRTDHVARHDPIVDASLKFAYIIQTVRYSTIMVDVSAMIV